MSKIKALEVPLDEDLRELSRYLWQQGLAHRITEQAGQQILWVQQGLQAEFVRDIYQCLRRGDPLPPVPPATRRLLSAGAAPFAPWLIPVTSLFIALSILGFLVPLFDGGGTLLHWLTFFDFQQIGNVMVYGEMGKQYWRLITPIFLHFGLAHIAFNMVLFWFLGRQVETLQGSVRLLGLILLLAMGSNIIQVQFSGKSIFGGMSGVVYGLLGYCWVWGLIRRDSPLQVQKPIMVMMMLSLVLDFVGYTKLLGIGAVANAAHIGGLVLGLLSGAGAALIARAAR
jgi:GlpG protein